MKSRASSIDSADNDPALKTLPFHRVRRTFSQRIPTHEIGPTHPQPASRPTLATELNVGTIAPYLTSFPAPDSRPPSAPDSWPLSANPKTEHEQDDRIERGLADMLTRAGPAAWSGPQGGSLRVRSLRRELTDDTNTAGAPGLDCDDSLSLPSFSDSDDEPPAMARRAAASGGRGEVAPLPRLSEGGGVHLYNNQHPPKSQHPQDHTANLPSTTTHALKTGATSNQSKITTRIPTKLQHPLEFNPSRYAETRTGNGPILGPGKSLHNLTPRLLATTTNTPAVAAALHPQAREETHLPLPRRPLYQPRFLRRDGLRDANRPESHADDTQSQPTQQPHKPTASALAANSRPRSADSDENGAWSDAASIGLRRGPLRENHDDLNPSDNHPRLQYAPAMLDRRLGLAPASSMLRRGPAMEDPKALDPHGEGEELGRSSRPSQIPVPTTAQSHFPVSEEQAAGGGPKARASTAGPSFAESVGLVRPVSRSSTRFATAPSGATVSVGRSAGGAPLERPRSVSPVEGRAMQQEIQREAAEVQRAGFKPARSSAVGLEPTQLPQPSQSQGLPRKQALESPSPLERGLRPRRYSEGSGGPRLRNPSGETTAPEMGRPRSTVSDGALSKALDSVGMELDQNHAPVSTEGTAGVDEHGDEDAIMKEYRDAKWVQGEYTQMLKLMEGIEERLNLVRGHIINQSGAAGSPPSSHKNEEGGDEAMQTHLQFINALAPLQLDQLKDFIRQTAAAESDQVPGSGSGAREQTPEKQMLTEQVQTDPEVGPGEEQSPALGGEPGGEQGGSETPRSGQVDGQHKEMRRVLRKQVADTSAVLKMEPKEPDVPMAGEQWGGDVVLASNEGPRVGILGALTGMAACISGAVLAVRVYRFLVDYTAIPQSPF